VILGVSMLPFLYNVYITAPSRQGHRGRPVGLRTLARVGDLLPAAAAQLHSMPRIRSESPAFDLIENGTPRRRQNKHY
jgi:cytochrome c oxidase subunit 1